MSAYRDMAVANARTEFGRDWPMSLPGAHGRIAAYRAALIEAADAIAAAWPYVNGVALDRSNSPWRIDTALATLATMDKARELIAAELAVTTP